MSTAYPEIAAPPVSQALAGYQESAGPARNDEAPTAPLVVPTNTSVRGEPELAQRKPIRVVQAPSGFTGGVAGAVVGCMVFPCLPTLLVGAYLGNRWQKNSRKKENTIYVKQDPADAAPAVPVKLWKLGETAPLTDSGLRLVLEARNADEMEKFLKRLWTLYHDTRLTREDCVQINSYAKHMVASMGLDCTVTDVLAGLRR